MMDARFIAVIVLIIAVGLLGWSAFLEHEARVRAEATVEQAEATADSALSVARRWSDSAQVLRVRADSAVGLLDSVSTRVAARARRRTEEVSRAGLAADVASADISTLLDTIMVYLPRPVRPLADSVRARVSELDEARELVAERFRGQSEDFARFRAQSNRTTQALIAAERAATFEAQRWRDAFSAERAAKQRWRTLATPGTLEQIKRALPFASWESTIAAVIAGGLVLVVR